MKIMNSVGDISERKLLKKQNTYYNIGRYDKGKRFQYKFILILSILLNWGQQFNLLQICLANKLSKSKEANDGKVEQ
jgi:hypothetical protein